MNSVVIKARSILSQFPKENIKYCFCYGSAFFKQAGKNTSSMLDLVFVVNNSYNFHEDNLLQKPWHYSALKYLGANSISRFQEQWGARMYYNTLIYYPAEDVTYKYGVISQNDFITDLLDWCHLYIAGRLHKPVAIIQECPNSELLTALRNNLFAAVHVALLTLPENFTEVEFYQTIANISYKGDFRMWFAEDKNKIKNIVLPQIEYFRELYSSVISSLSDFLHIPNNVTSTNCEQNMNPEARWHHLNNLPRVPQKEIVKYFNKINHTRRDTEEILQTMSYDPDVGLILNNILKKIVFKSSIKQSLKGIVTAGIVKSIKYSGRKIYKTLLSL
ncbi:hypothetical protein PGB90_004341 [Kerria lacca]